MRGRFTASVESGARFVSGLFATGQYGSATPTGPDPSTSFKGLFYGGGFHQLQFQIFGSLVICSAAFAVALLLMYGVKALGILRISPEHELEGLDIVEHGAPAFHPEYAYMGYSPIPGGKPTPRSPVSGSAITVGD